MKDALGLIEIQGLATAVLVADTMVKTANVTIIQIERARGHGWITVKVTGDVGAVNAAVSAGKQIGETFHHYISSKVIPRPSDSVEKVFCQTAKKEEKPTNPPEDTRASVMKEEAVEDTEIHAERIPEAEDCPPVLEMNAPAEPMAEPEETVQVSAAVLEKEETVLPEPAHEPDTPPVQQAVPPESEVLPVQEEIIPSEPEAAPEPATVPEPLRAEEKPEEQPSVPLMNESAVSPKETAVPPEKAEADSVRKPPVEKKATSGSTSATVKHTNSKKPAAKEKDPSKQPPRKPRGKKEK